jgi:hypothetical protein
VKYETRGRQRKTVANVVPAAEGAA